MKIFPILVAFLVLASFASANGLTYDNPACQGNNDLLNTLTNLPTCIVEGFFSFIVSGLLGTVQGFIDASFKFLFSTPDLKLFCAPYNAVLSVLEGLFSLVLMGLAIYFIFRSGDVEGRINAKTWLENMLVLIVLLAFSFSLFQLMLDLNSHLATSLANESMKNLFAPTGSFTSAIFALLMLLFIVILLVLTFVTLLVRYVLLPFLLLLFPVALFLYFVPPTQSFGKAFLKSIALLVFMTGLDALMLLALSSMFNVQDPNLSDALVRAFAVLFGFASIGIVNAALFLTALLSLLAETKAVSSALKLSILKKVLAK